MKIPYPSDELMRRCAEREAWRDHNTRHFSGENSIDSFFRAAKEGAAIIRETPLIEMFGAGTSAGIR